MTKIKFCGFSREEDVEFANELGVDFVGFVRDRRSRRYVRLEVAKLLSRFLGDPTPVLVHQNLSRPDKLEGAWHQSENFKSWISTGSHNRIVTVRAAPDLDPEAEPEVVCWLKSLGEQYLKSVRALIVDSFVPGQGGGTGQRVSTDWAARFVSAQPFPVLLAGGLTPDNVAEAIRIVRPYGVDVSSGIEVGPGVKDHGKMRAFVDAVRGVNKEWSSD